MKDENIIFLYQCSVTLDSIVKSDVLAYRQNLFSYYFQNQNTEIKRTRENKVIYRMKQLIIYYLKILEYAVYEYKGYPKLNAGHIETGKKPMNSQSEKIRLH